MVCMSKFGVGFIFLKERKCIALWDCWEVIGIID